MQNDLISTRWFPKCAFSAKNAALLDNVFADFDQQAEQLIGHDQAYMQLTRGHFRGRFLSAILGRDVAIHMEYCNQALEQEVSAPADYITFGVLLGDQDQFRVNGSAITSDDVFVLPPSGSLHVISPLNGAIMAITVRRDILLSHTGLTPVAANWLANLDGTVGYLQMPRLAHRLREDAIAAIESAADTCTAVPATMIGQALVASIASNLSLGWNTGAANAKVGATVGFERFQSCRLWLRTAHSQRVDLDDVAKRMQNSKRSVEQAFSQIVSMGPLTYLRVLRLHEVRRKLASPATDTRTIGDIAADHGFWDWSRFSQTYRQHFGELPSATRCSQVGRG